MSESTKVATAIPDNRYVEPQKVVHEFANEVVDPVFAEHDRNRIFPYETVSQMGEMSLFGLPFPEEIGGVDGDYLSFGITLEEPTKIDRLVAITLEAGVGLGVMPIFRFGSEKQKETCLPELTAGRRLTGFGLTEPDASSDAGVTRTTAREDNDDFVINGAKQFIINSGTDITSLATVTVVTGQREDDKRGISAIVVLSGTEGFVAEPAYDKVDWNTSDTHLLTFTGVHVPQKNPLGTRGRSFVSFLSILTEDRVTITALTTGAAQGCIDESVRYAEEHHSTGRAIGEYQTIFFKIARMEACAHITCMAWHDAAAKTAAGTGFRREAYIAKMIASEAVMDSARDTTRVFGGYGFMNEYRVACHHRDSKILEIDESTIGVWLTLIAYGLGL